MRMLCAAVFFFVDFHFRFFSLIFLVFSSFLCVCVCVTVTVIIYSYSLYIIYARVFVFVCVCNLI